MRLNRIDLWSPDGSIRQHKHTPHNCPNCTGNMLEQANKKEPIWRVHTWAAANNPMVMVLQSREGIDYRITWDNGRLSITEP